MGFFRGDPWSQTYFQGILSATLSKYYFSNNLIKCLTDNFWVGSKHACTKQIQEKRMFSFVKYRSSRSEVFCRKSALGNFAKSTGKNLYQSLFFNKVTGLGLWHRCFSVNFAKFLRTPFLQNTSEWRLLEIASVAFIFLEIHILDFILIMALKTVFV